MTTETKFLTLEEAKEKADYWHEYESGVYVYKLDGKYTLIENGKVLVDGVDLVLWYKEGVYLYQKDCKRFEVKNGITTEIYN